MPTVLQVRLTALLLRLTGCVEPLPALVAAHGIWLLAQGMLAQLHKRLDNRRAMQRDIPEIMVVLRRRPETRQSVALLAFQVFGKR